MTKGRPISGEKHQPCRTPVKRTQCYIVQLCKNREFIVIRFYKDDYGELNIKLIRKMIEPYIKDGWELMEIELIWTYKGIDE